MTSDLLTLAETAARLRVSTTYVRKLIREGALPAVHLGRRILVPAASVEAYVAANTRQAPALGAALGLHRIEQGWAAIRARVERVKS